MSESLEARLAAAVKQARWAFRGVVSDTYEAQMKAEIEALLVAK